MLRAFFITVVALLAGCNTPSQTGVESKYWESDGWRTETLQQLAFDYRTDGDFDLVFAREIPPEVIQELKDAARRVNENWIGE